MGMMLSTGNSSPSKDSLREVVYEIVAQIPRGQVLTYGAIARLAGYPNHSRLVGRMTCPALPRTGFFARRRRRKVVLLRQSLFEDIPLVSVKYLERAPRGGSLC